MRALSLLGTAEVDPLVHRLRRGESAALGEAYDAHHQTVRAFALRLLGDPEAAEDLVHEVFVALPRAIGNFKGDSALRTFLTGIAVNHARHFVRSAVRRRAALERLGAVEAQPAPASPESTAIQRSLARALTKALDALPLKQRVAFVLCDVEERSATEAGAIVGAPEGTVRTRLFHARKRLRAELSKQGVEV